MNNISKNKSAINLLTCSSNLKHGRVTQLSRRPQKKISGVRNLPEMPKKYTLKNQRASFFTKFLLSLEQNTLAIYAAQCATIINNFKMLS